MDERAHENHEHHEPPELMTIKEVAAAMRVETRTVFRWINSGRLRAFRVGGVTRIRRRDLLGAMEKHEHGGPPSADPAMG